MNEKSDWKIFLELLSEFKMKAIACENEEDVLLLKGIEDSIKKIVKKKFHIYEVGRR